MSNSPVRCSHFIWGNKKVIFQHYYSYTSDCLRYLRRKQIATVVLQLWLCTYCCLVLPIICIALVLRLGHTTGGARVLIWTCWGLWQRLVATWAEFQHRVMYYATDQCRKKLEACFNGEGGHSEHVLYDIACLTFQLPHITTGSFQSHRWQRTTGSLERLQRLTERNKPSVRWKRFVIYSLVRWHFQEGWASGLQFIFFGYDVINQKYVWITLLKITFFVFPKAKWLHLTGEVDKSVKCSCQIFSGFNMPEIIKIG